ncbi:hypothetical protein [Jeotgalibacillus proteolyticus]|uniref:Uncharacterized protein n=1 Tax=Jeotgalibacillus proteolyticus TaxID=2082395 RepID=A0A2S5GB38_9BACL|nr:hypothetical protein [Jeotgalibacillus proteolyticus]PPA70209.1 hypothetical protein C4B60_11535 [Jeotgalibacillus proteolyticus]
MNLKAVFLILTLLLAVAGCQFKSKTYDAVWVQSSISSQETIDSAVERLSDANIKFIINKNGDVLIDERDMVKAVTCCS